MMFIHCQTGGSSQCNRSNRRQKDQKERSKAPLLTDTMIFYRENPKETAKEFLEQPLSKFSSQLCYAMLSHFSRVRLCATP